MINLSGSQKTGYVWNERYAWHDTGTATGFLAAGGYYQPLKHYESADSKRRLAELLSVSGLTQQLERLEPIVASEEDILRFHTPAYIERLKTLNVTGGNADQGGVDHSPFGPGSYDIARLSAGGCMSLLEAVWLRQVKNGYALTRPPGHHAEADNGRGFCLLANGVIAVEYLRHKYGSVRVAIVDWDVHHGNGAQKAFYSDPTVLTISVHQDRNYPVDSGMVSENGMGAGLGANLNIPLPAGTGHDGYMLAFDRVILPALMKFQPQIIIVHSGFDACAVDPLGRMMLHSGSYREMTAKLMQAADVLCDGRLAMFHEGGYSEAYVPFCGLAVLEELSAIRTDVVDHMYEHLKTNPAHHVTVDQSALILEVAQLLPKVPMPS